MSHTLEITAHAIDRWAERVRPGRTKQEAARDLEQCLSVAEIYDLPPSWARTTLRSDTVYVWLGEDVVLPARCGPNGLLRLATVITRHDQYGCHAEACRRRRQARRHKRRSQPRTPRPRSHAMAGR